MEISPFSTQCRRRWGWAVHAGIIDSLHKHKHKQPRPPVSPCRPPITRIHRMCATDTHPPTHHPPTNPYLLPSFPLLQTHTHTWAEPAWWVRRQLRTEDVQGAGLLLTRAFAGTPEAVRLEEAV